jgi:CheY-like chemotaxis protein
MNPPPSQTGRRRVLLLDDDQFTLALLTEMFARLGQFEVAVETDARRALAALPVQAPDLLVCDLALPDMDGVEFLQGAANQRFRGEVVLLSGMASGVLDAAAELARVLGLRVAGRFRKPIDMDQLRGVVGSRDFVQGSEHFSTK